MYIWLRLFFHCINSRCCALHARSNKVLSTDSKYWHTLHPDKNRQVPSKLTLQPIKTCSQKSKSKEISWLIIAVTCEYSSSSLLVTCQVGWTNFISKFFIYCWWQAFYRVHKNVRDNKKTVSPMENNHTVITEFNVNVFGTIFFFFFLPNPHLFCVCV